MQMVRMLHMMCDMVNSLMGVDRYSLVDGLVRLVVDVLMHWHSVGVVYMLDFWHTVIWTSMSTVSAVGWTVHNSGSASGSNASGSDMISTIITAIGSVSPM